MRFGSMGNAAQFLRRSSFRPWNRPPSTSTRWPPRSSRCFDPVTVPAAPRNVIVDIRMTILEVMHRMIRAWSLVVVAFVLPALTVPVGAQQKRLSLDEIYDPGQRVS